jgi:hypothetical protein
MGNAFSRILTWCSTTVSYGAGISTLCQVEVSGKARPDEY